MCWYDAEQESQISVDKCFNTETKSSIILATIVYILFSRTGFIHHNMIVAKVKIGFGEWPLGNVPPPR